jgi:hypothetical protein
MNLVLVKSVLWGASTLLFGVLGWTLYDYKVAEADLLGRKVNAKLQQDLLKDIQPPPPPKSDLVDYKRVTANFHDFNWTGKAPPPPPPPPPPPGPTRRVIKPLKDLLTVLYIQVDTSQASNSLALVRWVDRRLSDTLGAREDGRLQAGFVLPEPYAYWSVESVESEGVIFRYAPEDDQDKNPTTFRLSPPTPIEGGIVKVAEDGEVRLPAEFVLPEAGGEFVLTRPARTLELGPNRFRVGSEDGRYINENYLDILSREVRHKSHFNRKKGRMEGIEITEVAPGSIAAQHGVKSGDVIVSVNGTPVNSVQEAISYAKNNADIYSVWTIVVSNAGYERTIVYETE